MSIVESTAVQSEPPTESKAAPKDLAWRRFLLRRFAGFVLSLVILIVITFLIVPLLPGDPAVTAAGEGATQTQIDDMRQRLGLEAPWYVQFGRYVAGIFTMDLGRSFSTGESVLGIIAARLPFTAEIAFLALLGILIVAIPVGMTVAVLTRGGRNQWLDVTFNAVTSFFYSVPQYVMGTLLIATFAIGLKWFPPAGAATLKSLVLPVTALMIQPICTISRVVRREAAVVFEQDFVRTARGWRLPPFRTNTFYVFPNLITTTLTLSGLILAAQLGGAIVIEMVFNWPGLGQGIVTAILDRDYPTIRGIILVLGLLATMIIILVDTVLALIDPRNLGASRGN